MAPIAIISRPRFTRCATPDQKRPIVNIVRCPFFTTNLLEADHELMRDYRENDSFVALIFTSGEAVVTCGEEKTLAHQGETILIPASAKGISIEPKGKVAVLETYV